MDERLVGTTNLVHRRASNLRMEAFRNVLRSVEKIITYLFDAECLYQSSSKISTNSRPASYIDCTLTPLRIPTLILQEPLHIPDYSLLHPSFQNDTIQTPRQSFRNPRPSTQASNRGMNQQSTLSAYRVGSMSRNEESAGERLGS